jgi:hypothetical protein
MTWMGDDVWERIWRGAEERLARLLAGDSESGDGVVAPVVELRPPVEDADEPEEPS